MITAAMEKRKMDKYINAKSLYNQVAEKEELAKQRVIDTPSRLPNGDVNPYAIRYAAQLDERTTFKFMLADAPAADVIEIIRCKDCIYHTGDDECTNGRWNNWSNSYYDELYPEALEMDYCSYGVRKNG